MNRNTSVHRFTESGPATKFRTVSNAAFWGLIFFALQAAASAQPSPVPASSMPRSACGQTAICGLKNPEDVVRLGNSRFAIASSLARLPAPSSHLYLVDLKAKTAKLLDPTVSAGTSKEYPSCPPPKIGSLITHGLAVRMDGPDRGDLFVVNHGGRESVEIFKWLVGARNVALTWVGCVLVPPGVFTNAVTPLPDGLAVTSFGSPKDPNLVNLLAGHPSGFVMIWTARGGWTHLKGSELPGDNGIAASPDGHIIYINAWANDALWILARDGEQPPVRIALGDFHPDNVHWQQDGTLLIAGEVGSMSSILDCSTRPFCPKPSMLVVFDPKRRAITLRAEFPPTAHFGASSTAIYYQGYYWLSSFVGDRLIEVTPKRPKVSNERLSD